MHFPFVRNSQFGSAIAAAILLSLTAGCHRAHYRNQADREVYSLIGEKTSHPHWNLQRYEIQIDPRSRMFDPFNPDREPMPPDDPVSHELMHYVDNKHGYPHWHANGDTPGTENPDWHAFLPLNEDGVLVLDAETALELALIHSRDYQRQLEELYLSALDVSFERFQFDGQFFAGVVTDFAHTGRLRPGNGGESQSNFLVGTSGALPSGSPTALVRPSAARMQKAFTSGSEMVIGLANTLMWQFAGPDDYSARTIIDFTMVQPILRNAGRDRVMETLTLSERTLLNNVRQMEQFRLGFYVEIMTGRDAGQGPSRRGGVFGGSGFSGFTGTGGGGFGGLTGTGGAAGGGGTGGAQVGGFMGLLQSEQEIRNQEDNLNSLRTNYFNLLVNLDELLTTIPENTEAVVSQRLQVAQAREAMLNAESRLIITRANYQAELDRFKILLGLPPTLCVKINDPMLKSVNVVDPEFRPIQNGVTALQAQIGDTVLAMLPQGNQFVIEWNDELAGNLRSLKASLGEVEDIRRQLMDGEDAQIRRVRADGIKLGERLAGVLDRATQERTDELASARGGVAGTPPRLVGPAPLDLDQLKRDAEVLRHVLDQMKQGDDWIPGLQRWKQLDDHLQDVDRLNLQLAKGESFAVDWLLTDSNPATRDLHTQFGQRVADLETLIGPARTAAAAQLQAELEQNIQSVTAEVQQIVVDQDWIGHVTTWRTNPSVVEATAAGDTATEIRRLKRLFVQFADTLVAAPLNFDTLPEKIAAFEKSIDALLADGPTLTPDEVTQRFRRDISPVIPQELVDLSNNVLELSLVQARDRTETVSLIEVDLHPAAALEIARQNRRDWMNARAALVDSWRLIEFNADQLESSLDVIFSGDIQNHGDNPVALRGPTGRLRAGLQFDAPLTRLDERNRYRESLIQYQRARRDYYAFEDQISRGLRDSIRTIGLNRRNFELRREAVRVADLQIELNEARRRIRELSNAPSGETAARDAVSALSALLTAQNDFLSVWVTYEVLRRTLDFDLGTIQLDEDGMWIDPGAIGPEKGYPGIKVDPNDPCWPGRLDGIEGMRCGPYLQAIPVEQPPVPAVDEENLTVRAPQPQATNDAAPTADAPAAEPPDATVPDATVPDAPAPQPPAELEPPLLDSDSTTGMMTPPRRMATLPPHVIDAKPAQPDAAPRATPSEALLDDTAIPPITLAPPPIRAATPPPPPGREPARVNISDATPLPRG